MEIMPHKTVIKFEFFLVPERTGIDVCRVCDDAIYGQCWRGHLLIETGKLEVMKTVICNSCKDAYQPPFDES